MVGQLGAVSGEQLFLQLFCKVGLEDAHQLFLGDGSCPQHFQKLLSFPENRKNHVDHFGCFPSQPTPRFSDYLSEYCHRVPNWSVHDSFPDLTIIIGPFVPCADMEMVRGSLSVALKVPLILISSLSPQCQAKCWHTHLGMDT